jgi:hypothetical protein
MRAAGLLFAAVLTLMQFVPGTPQPGTVAGKIEIKATAPQQAASRYPLPGGQVQKSVAPIPTVVFVDGPVTGAPAWPRIPRPEIVQKDLQFSPVLLVIPRDVSVAFPNEDSEFHNVFSYSKPKRFDLGRYPKGESKSVVFDRPGIVKIYCEVHPWMRAAVLVLENPYYAVVSGDGTFAIRGIPAGHYDLTIWNIDAGSKKVEVDVSPVKSPQLMIRLTGEFDAGVEEQTLNPAILAGAGRDRPGDLSRGACCAGKSR